MALLLRLALLAAVLVVSAEGLFAPDCVWGALMDSSEESGERLTRPTERPASARFRDSRVRRFLWRDRDVCDYMCSDGDDDDICRRCCPKTAATKNTTTKPTSASTESSTAETTAAARRR